MNLSRAQKGRGRKRTGRDETEVPRDIPSAAVVIFNWLLTRDGVSHLSQWAREVVCGVRGRLLAWNVGEYAFAVRDDGIKIGDESNDDYLGIATTTIDLFLDTEDCCMIHKVFKGIPYPPLVTSDCSYENQRDYESTSTNLMHFEITVRLLQLWDSGGLQEELPATTANESAANELRDLSRKELICAFMKVAKYFQHGKLYKGKSLRYQISARLGSLKHIIWTMITRSLGVPDAPRSANMGYVRKVNWLKSVGELCGRLLPDFSLNLDDLRRLRITSEDVSRLRRTAFKDLPKWSPMRDIGVNGEIDCTETLEPFFRGSLSEEVEVDIFHRNDM